MIATAPGKLIVAGEYAVLDGAMALVVAVNRRVIARRRRGPQGSSPFLVALVGELERRGAADAAKAAVELVVDSRTFYDGEAKLGLGSSAAVTVAATALALAGDAKVPVIDRELVMAIAMAAHAHAQAPKGTRGSGADVAAAVHGGLIGFRAGEVERLAWPAGVRMIPFYTGASAETGALVARVRETKDTPATAAALAAIARAAKAAGDACRVRIPEVASTGLVAALALGATGMDQLAAATGVPLVPTCVIGARAALARLGGTAKTTGAGGGDVAVAVLPSAEDATAATRYIREAGGKPLRLALDPAGVDLQPDAQ